MRGKYKTGQRRVVTGSVYKIVIAAVAVLAVALVLLLLAFLPAVEDEPSAPRTIVSIESEQSAVGMASKPSLLYVKVTYSDGTTDTVPLSETSYTGLDLSVEGTQKVALSYGGFEQIIEFNVKNVDCILEYEAGQGGSISGETRQYVANGGTGAAVRAVPERGYVFVSWDDNYPNALRQDNGVTANITHTAKFEKAKYVVRFYLPDGTVATEEVVQYESRPTKIPSPDTDPRMKVYGYKFNGWVPNNFTSITRDTDIYPSYERIATDVSIALPNDIYGNKMGEISDTSSGMLQYYEHGKPATITVKPYNSREFAYWLVTDTDGNEVTIEPTDSKTVRVGIGGNELTFTSNPTGASKTEYSLSFTPNSEIDRLNIQAIFAYSNSTVTFINYQNSANKNVEFTVEGLPFGEPLSSRFPKGIPDPQDVVGMTFEKWYLLGDENQTRIDGTETFRQPATLVAKWKRKQYTIKFVYEENSVEKTFHAISVSYQDTLASGIGLAKDDGGRFVNGFPTEEPTKANYRFIGWQDTLTGSAVDAKTALYAAAEHIANADFTENQTLYYVPIWEPLRHRLTVGVEGTGGVKLIEMTNVLDTNNKPIEKVENVYGECIIEQDKKYQLRVEAAEGYKIKRIIWFFGAETVDYDYSDGHTTETQFDIFNDRDNSIYVEFEVLKLTVTVKNGTPDYYGHIYYGEDETAQSADSFTLAVSYNANAKLRVESYNETYSIEDIKIDGVSIGDVFDETLSYTLVLPQIKADVTVEIIYSTRKYRVQFNLDEGGSAYIVDLFDDTVKTEIPSGSEYEYLFGTSVYFKIEAKNDFSERKILRSMRYNGELVELFTNSAVANLTLYGWDINGEPYQIALSYINGYYYFDYGSVMYDGAEYEYCEDISRREARLFTKTAVGDMTIYGEVNAGAPNYEETLNFVRTELGIEKKTLANTYIDRDRRITSLYFRLTVGSHVNFNFNFEDIGYSVTAADDDKGVVTISNPNPSYKDSCVLSAAPKSGYYISGYRINDGEIVPVYNNRAGEKISLRLDDIECDNKVEFIFETITYRVTVIDKTSSGAVGVTGGEWNGDILNYSLGQSFDYHAFVEITIKTKENKRISKLTIDGTSVETHFDMTEYRLVLSDVTKDVTVTVETADRETAPSDGSVYSLYWAKRDAEYTVSAKYINVGSSTVGENAINVRAAHGRRITSVELIDGDGKNIVFDDEVSGLTEKFGLTVPENVFTGGANVEVRVFTEVIKYNFDVEVEGGIGGSVSPEKGEFEYNMDAKFTVIADTSDDVTKGHCHIESFKVNGEEIAFNSNAWSALSYDASTGHYTYGVYTARVVGDMKIVVKFAKDVFKISVDEMSVNGTTVLSLDDGVADYAPYGSKLHINMKADEGYRIAGLYINDRFISGMDYSAGNDLTEAAYTYNGAVVNGVETGGITERLKVRVAYEIKRYGFNFNIVNASENFSGDTDPGTFYTTDGLTLSGNRYTGIEHGSNFSFDVKPTVSSGYYLYSVAITYVTGLGVTHTLSYEHTENVFSSKGGTIWFNRFVEADGMSTKGVIGDIELIEVTFKRNYYQLNFEQTSAADTGAMRVKFSHPTGSVKEAVVFDGEGNKYFYREEDNVFYKSVDGVLTPTDIRAEIRDGRYIYTDGEKDIEIFVEHGLRYKAELVPYEGFETVLFTVNGEDATALLNGNSYSTNLVRNTALVAAFRKLVYDVSFTATVSDKSLTGTIPTRDVTAYARVSVILIEGEIYDLNYNLITDIPDGYEFVLPTGKNVLRLSDETFGGGYKLGYGSLIKIVMYPNFDGSDFGDDGKGYYVYSLYYGDTEIDLADNSYGDRKVMVEYSGDGAGLKVVGEITARAGFRIMRYNIRANAAYVEKINGESANGLTVEQGNDVAWGEDAFIRIDMGAGYDYAATGTPLTVVRGVRGVDPVITVHLDGVADEANGICYYESKTDDLGREREGVEIKSVKSDIDLTAVFERERHTVRFVFNDADKLDKVSITVNDGITYPKLEITGSKDNSVSDRVNWSADDDGKLNIYNVPTHYYDEISAILKPKNGYEIAGNYVRMAAVDENRTPIKDASGDEIAYVLGLNGMSYLSGSDEKSFDFRDIVGLYVAYDLELSFELKIKTYELNSVVNRVDSVSANHPNTTAVNVLSKDENGEDILLYDGKYQGGQILERDKATKMMTAQHHGYLLYTFPVPEGYALSRLTVNGAVYSDDDLRTSSGFDNGSVKYAPTYFAGVAPYYYYAIEIAVNDKTLNGAEYGRLSRIDVTIEVLPISYDVITYINGVPYDNKTIGVSSGVTDDKTLTVLMPPVVEHFNDFTLRPTVSEGYEVRGVSFKTGSNTEAADNTMFSTANPGDRKTLAIVNGNMPFANVLDDKTTIHIYYTTGIKSYGVSVKAYAYTIDNELAPNGGGFVALDSKAGKVSVDITPDIEGGYVDGGEYEYFSTVRVEAFSKSNADTVYRLAEITEILTNPDGSEREWTVVNGQRGILYEKSADGSGKEMFTYTVGPEGSRKFKVIFKQEMRITVTVPNPYKYVNGRHAGYVRLNAYENGVLLTNISNAALNAGYNEYVYEYAYDVLVGNFISFTYSETVGATVLKQPTYCAYDEKTGEYIDKQLAPREEYPNKGIGLIITEQTDLHVVNDVNGRIIYSKDTLGAVETNVGGIILFENDASETRYNYYDTATTVGRKITFTVKPEISNRHRYAFGKLYIRQVDVERSKQSGMLVFKEGDEEWVELNDSYTDQYGYKITRGEDDGVNAVFTVDMRGDIYIKAEFYRIYELEYGINYTDRGVVLCDPEDGDAPIKLQNTVYNDYGDSFVDPTIEPGSETEQNKKYYVQYKSEFSLTAPEGNLAYRFMGWYINGENAWKNLNRLLPDETYLTKHFILTANNTPGLVTNDVENMKLRIIAVYQPVISVAVINELYYYDIAGKHWNSWESGIVNVSANVFEDNESNIFNTQVPGAATVVPVANSNATTVADRSYNRLSELYGQKLNNLKESEDYATSSTPVAKDYRWNTLLTDEVNADKKGSPISTDSRVHTATSYFKVLYQSISNGEFVTDSWKNGALSLSLVGVPYSVKFQTWQYYNWNAGAYMDIGYVYRDISGVQKSCRDENYRFAMEYMFENSANMPYAISATKADNTVNDRPLIIRPNFKKVVEVQLSQLAYTTALGGEATAEFKSIMHPRINRYTNSPLYHNMSDDRTTGMFDYGATINIHYYNRTEEVNGITKPINYKKSETSDVATEQYRFIGWRLNWTDSAGSTAYYMIFTPTEDDDGVGGVNVKLSYAYNNAPPNEIMELEALFIKQYLNELYSYNVAASDRDYNAAMEGGRGAYQNAPDLTVTMAQQMHMFHWLDRDTNTSSDREIYYSFDPLDSGNALGSENRIWMFMCDVGAVYNIKVNVLNSSEDAASDMDEHPGYNPNFDHEYKVYHYKNSTELDKEKLLEAGFKGEDITVNGTFKLDVQYASKVRLQFNNLMYSAGIVVPESLAKYLTKNDQVTALTVWDNDSYGEPVDNVILGKGVIDGTVVIKMDLVNVKGFGGMYNYALNGFNEGVGITATSSVSYYSNGEKITNLFDASVSNGFKRVIEIDYDEYISGGTLMFGNPNWNEADGSKYSVDNTGDGSVDAPYNIYNAVQLRNIGIYFHFNSNTCKGVHFRLRADIMITNVVDLSNPDTVAQLKKNNSLTDNPGTTEKAWTPICHYYDEESDTHLGFDGHLSGKKSDDWSEQNCYDNYYIYGLAAQSSSFLGYNDARDPMTYYINYEQLAGYGIFGCINGGTIEAVNIGNAYVDLLGTSASSGSFNTVKGLASYIGILTARSYNSTFRYMKFDENTTLGRTTQTNANTGMPYSRVYLRCQTSTGIGMLAGYAEETTVRNISVNVSNADDINIDISTNNGDDGNIGALFGVFSGASRFDADNLSTEKYVKETDVFRGAYVDDITLTSVNKASRLLLGVSNVVKNVGGIFGAIRSGADVTNVTIDGAPMILGKTADSDTAVANVGGIVGLVHSARVYNPIVKSANADTRNSADYLNIYLETNAVSESGQSMGSEASKAGKAGGIAGLAIAAKLEGMLENAAVQGVIVFRGATYGGIVGVAAGGTLVQRFELRSPTYIKDDKTEGRVYLMFEFQSATNMSGGGIVGANLSDSIVDDCSITGAKTSAVTETSGTNLGASIIYVYRDDDESYQSVPSIGTNAPSTMRKLGVVNGESVYVGGLVGYNSAQVYNSFTKGGRITVKYQNGGVINKDDNKGSSWQVYAGGIVGYFDVVDTSFTYYGLTQIYRMDRVSGVTARCRVQSCYSRDFSIAMMGYVWCDGTSEDSRGVLFKNAQFTIGGIVGGTSQHKYGEYAINTCYTYNCNYVLRIGAYGIKDTTKDEDPKKGWLFTSTYDPAAFKTFERNQPFRPGIALDGFIYGIVGHKDEYDDYSSANHCWSIGNSAVRYTPQGKAYLTGEENITDDQKEMRAVKFTDEKVAASVMANRSSKIHKAYANASGLEQPAYWQSNYPIAMDYALANEKVTVDLSKVGMTFSGGMVGVYNVSTKKSTDGRIFKTDITCGQLEVGHAATINDNDLAGSWYEIEHGEFKRHSSEAGGLTNAQDSYWSFLRTKGATWINGKLVRGQDTVAMPG